MNPTSSFAQRTPAALRAGTLPWWEAVPWAGPQPFAGVRGRVLGWGR